MSEKDFIIGQIYPHTYCKIMSKIYPAPDGKHKNVQYTCTFCNSGIIYETHYDNIQSGHTWRCAECGRKYHNMKPPELDYPRKSKSTKDNINYNNLKSKHYGEIRGQWLIQEYDHSDLQGHSYYNCKNINTGEIKPKRLDTLPHNIDNILKNIIKE